MIRAGRGAVDAAAIARRLGLELKQLHDRKIVAAGSPFPAPVTSSSSSKRLWDEQQVDSYLTDPDGVLPPIPDVDDPDDLLDRGDAAALIGVRPDAWDTYPKLYRHTTNPVPGAIMVCGVPHHRRRDLDGWKSRRVGRGAGAGRPTGRETREREATKRNLDAVEQLLREAGEASAATVAERVGVSVRQAQRLLARLSERGRT